MGSPARLPFAGTDPVRTVVQAWEDEGRTAVLVLHDGAPAGVLGIADRLRPDAAATVAALKKLTGRSPALLTGDNERAAAHLAAEVGITEFRAGLLPQDKVSAVKDWEAQGRKVLVVGDGVNDAPALATAHTGIAMGRAGSDLALETADAVVVRDELATIPTVVTLAPGPSPGGAEPRHRRHLHHRPGGLGPSRHSAAAPRRRRARGFHRHRRPQRSAPAPRCRLGQLRRGGQRLSRHLNKRPEVVEL